MSFSTEPFSEINNDGEVYLVSTWGVLIDNTVISIVDGRLAANMLGEQPDTDITDEFMVDYLPDEAEIPQLVQFNTSTNRYELVE